MTTALEKTIKRALAINGRDYVIALSPETLKVTLKGHRLGVEIKWLDLISGETALATALQASLGKLTEDKTASAPTIKRVRQTAKSKSTRRAAKR
jgi:hypothetical protein